MIYLQISSKDYPLIEIQVRKIIKSKVPFERIEISKADLLQLFSYNRFKMKIIEEKITEDRATIYRCGSLIDLCSGPHIRHAGNVKVFKIHSVRKIHFRYLNDFFLKDLAFHLFLRIECSNSIR